MELKQISGQQGQTLLEFYDPKDWPDQWGKMPEMMSKLIRFLHSVEREPVWVFTSHAELLFTNRDDYEDWQVLVKIVKMDGKQYFKIIAAQENPWHHLTGFADNHELASELIINGLLVSAIGKNRNIFLDSN